METMATTTSAAPVIRIQGATVYLGGREILHDLSFEMKHGERCFVLGANGAGKTTLVKLLMGYAWPLYGAQVEVLGQRFGQVNLVELRKKIAWVSPFLQQWADPEWRAIDVVISALDGTLGLFRKALPEEIDRAMALLRRMRAEHLAQQQLYTLSSGEQVKILIARALLTDPELMILDEPNVYLDLAGREFLLDAIAELAESRPELSIIFVTQRIEDILPLFKNGVILGNGRILASGERDAVLTEERLTEAFGLPVKLIRNHSGRFWAMIE